MSEHYTVGIATDPPVDPKYYADERQAIDKAAMMAQAEGYNVPIAVWDDRGDIVWLFLCGQQFRSV